MTAGGLGKPAGGDLRTHRVTLGGMPELDYFVVFLGELRAWQCRRISTMGSPTPPWSAYARSRASTTASQVGPPTTSPTRAVPPSQLPHSLRTTAHPQASPCSGAQLLMWASSWS